LFSAAWRADVSPALTLWSLSDVTLVSSAYAIDEAEPNLDRVDSRTRLAAKDRPILLAAISAKCSDLLTGDRRHFGSLFGRSIEGVRIVTVRDYLTRRTVAEDPLLDESDD
jgi:hypothetical protein